MLSIKDMIQQDIAEKQKKVDELMLVDQLVDSMPECLALMPFDYVSITPWHIGDTKARIYVSTYGKDPDWLPLMKAAFEREGGVIFENPPDVSTFGSLILEGEYELPECKASIILSGPPTKKCVKVRVPVVIPGKPATEAVPEKIEYKTTVVCPGKELPPGAILIEEE